MGGAAAKKRRKDERQHLQPADGTFDDDGGGLNNASAAQGGRKDKHFTRAHHSHEKFVLKKPTKNDKSQKAATGVNSAKKKNNKTEKKFKKPKHLKRKLETAEDEQTKEQLLQVLQEFEQKKQGKNKKPRLSLDKQSNGAPALKEEQVHDSFPRSAPSKGPGAEKSNKKSKAPPSDSESESSSSDDESSGNGEKKPKTFKPLSKTEQARASPASSSSADQKSSSSGTASGDDDKPSSDEDSSSDEEGDHPDQQTRTRGKRRRGRKSTSQVVKEKVTPAGSENQEEEQPKQQQEGKYDDKKDTKSKKDRYCIGRKPVTDFIVGQTCPGKVVYLKPFGIFLDIGCHSDAFCHISRLHDDYVEKPEVLFRPGDLVPAARVIEVDRKNKRITVSLQSKARIADERKSIEARQQRKQKQPGKANATPSGNSSSRPVGDKNSQNKVVPEQYQHQQRDYAGQEDAKPQLPTSVSKNTAFSGSKTESEMTPAELKRARKLARRAQRRAEREENGNDNDE